MIDFLKQETAKLQRLQSESQSALDLVTRTIDRLKNANEQIGEAQARISAYQADLENQSKSLTALSQKNTRIIANFNRLIEG